MSQMPDKIAEVLKPWFSEDFDLRSVRMKQKGLLCILFGLLGQWAITWNQTINFTWRAPFTIQDGGVVGRRKGESAQETWAAAMWLISHECLHVQQQRELGWGRFLWAYVKQWLRHKGGRGNRFEGPAYDLGDRVYHSLKRSGGPRDAD
jgi:hypothetical protein